MAMVVGVAMMVVAHTTDLAGIDHQGRAACLDYTNEQSITHTVSANVLIIHCFLSSIDVGGPMPGAMTVARSLHRSNATRSNHKRSH